MPAHEIRHGLWGGLIGGLVFAGIMVVNGTLTDMGMLTLPLIGSIVGHPSVSVGLAVHLLNSAIIGVGYVLTLGRFERGMVDGLHLGMIYGTIWWFIGPLTLMPLLLGEPVGNHWSIGGALAAFPSLIGHLVFGVILGMTVGAFRDYSLTLPDGSASGESDESDEPNESDDSPLEHERRRSRADFAESPPRSARPKGAGAPRLVPIWMSMGLIAVVLVLNLVIFGYAAISGGFPHPEERQAAVAPVAPVEAVEAVEAVDAVEAAEAGEDSLGIDPDHSEPADAADTAETAE
jgi:uncharacterized membrane protein YagU involved in acid resistance